MAVELLVDAHTLVLDPLAGPVFAVEVALLANALGRDWFVVDDQNAGEDGEAAARVPAKYLAGARDDR